MKYNLYVESYKQKYSHYHLLFDKYNLHDVHDGARSVYSLRRRPLACWDFEFEPPGDVDVCLF